MEETITLKEGTGEEAILIVTTPTTREIPLKVLRSQRKALANQKSVINSRLSVLDATIAKAEEVIAVKS